MDYWPPPQLVLWVLSRWALFSLLVLIVPDLLFIEIPLLFTVSYYYISRSYFCLNCSCCSLFVILCPFFFILLFSCSLVLIDILNIIINFGGTNCTRNYPMSPLLSFKPAWSRLISLYSICLHDVAIFYLFYAIFSKFLSTISFVLFYSGTAPIQNWFIFLLLSEFSIYYRLDFLCPI